MPTYLLSVVKSYRISSFIKYSKLRHLHTKSTSSEHVMHDHIICIKVKRVYLYASVLSVLLSVKQALIKSQIQCTVYISHYFRIYHCLYCFTVKEDIHSSSINMQEP